MSKKQELKKLEKKEDGEIPLRWEDWGRLLKKDIGTLWLASQKYRMESETPADLLKNDEDAKHEVAVTLAFNFDEWAPDLFRAMDTERGQERRYKKRFIQTDNIESLAVVDETENTERVAMLKQVMSSKKFQRFSKYAPLIGEAKLKDPDATDKEIGKELGISQQYVSAIWKKVQPYFLPQKDFQKF